MKMKTKFKLINYFDVWGNQKDGYEVNNLCSEGEIRVQSDYNNKDLIQALKEKEFFKKHVRSNMVRIENLGDMIEFNERRTGKPTCRLELMEQNVIAVWGISNSASLNVWDMKADEAMFVGINDDEPEWCEIEWINDPDQDDNDEAESIAVIDFNGRHYKLNECMKIQ